MMAMMAGCHREPAASLETPGTNSSSSTDALPPSSSSIPLRTIASLKAAWTAENDNAFVRVRGTVLDERLGEYIVVNDGTETIFAETHQAGLPAVTEQVDLEGQPVSDGYSVGLKNAVASPVEAISSNFQESASSARPAKLPLLDKVWKIRDLPEEKAAWHYPVQLRGIVTVNAHYKDYFFVQDDSAGISIQMQTNSTSPKPGDFVKIEGVSDPGNYSPIVLASNVTVISSGRLPLPKPETLFQLATGQDGSQWIEVRGVVRSMSFSNGIAQINLSDLSGMITVKVPAEREPVQLLDAIVRINGACGSTANEKRQLVRSVLWASSLDDVHVEEPGVTDPFSLPVQPIASLNRFHPRQTLQHRINLAGLVTMCDFNSFFIEDADAGVHVMALPGQLKQGDYMMASGYPSLGDYGYVLRNVVFKVIGHRRLPAPQQLTEETNLVPEWHDRWVQADARLLQHMKIDAADVLTLQIGNRVFEAQCLASDSARMKNLDPGSLLRVTGLYRVLADEARVPRSFQLTLPSEQDVQILEEPTWWTVAHTANVVGIMAVIIGATILWVMMLRRKVREQTAGFQRSERKFRMLVEQSLVGVYIIQDDRFVYVNPRMAEIFGYTPEEMTASCHLMDVVLQEDRPLVLKQIRRRLAGEIEFAHYFFRGRRKDGCVIQIEVLGRHTEFGGKSAVLGMLMDVTERELAQDKIAEQARMLDLAGDAIIVSDMENRILYWNQSAQRIYGWTAQESFGGVAFEKMRIDPVEFNNARQALLQDYKWHGEFNHRDANGGEIVVEARWTLVRDAHGKPASILAINTDITQAKKLEAQFLRTQRLESIGVLAGGIAHDLNNIFAPILMSCQLLEMSPDESERRQLQETILVNTRRAADLVKQILTFARGTNGRRIPAHPHQVIQELRKILDETLPKSIQLQVNLASDGATIAADTIQLHQVLMNLCINARDAMPDGGILTLAVADIEMKRPRTLTSGEIKPGSYVVFSVTDNGIGMAPEIRERIFEPFFTTKEVGRGTGLGLSTALGIVKSHGGFINVSSAAQHGSCFQVYLPALVSNHEPAAQIPHKDAPLVRGHDELILVVDDEPAIRNIAKRTLQMFGYRVLTANDGQEAIACYLDHKNEIALVLMDMMMPVLDGPAAIDALVQINPEIKIIAASGLTTESQVKCPAVRAFLRKPYAAEDMLNAISEVLHSKNGGKQAAH
jgi:PAS domain S-box-containing protein